MTGSKVARAALTAICGAAILAPPAARAQLPVAPVAAPPLSLSPEERAALQALQTAASGVDRAAQDRALAAARSAVRSNDGRYALGHFQLQIGQARADAQLTGQAVDLMVDSGLARPEELPSLLTNQASRAYYAAEFERADRLLARATELQPNNAAIVADHGQVKARRGDLVQAVALLQRAIGLQRTGGAPAPESWHQRGLALAFDATQSISGRPPVAPQLAPQAISLGRELVSAYPSASNWRDALAVYRQLATAADPALDLDALRLMRATQALSGERDYLQYAEALGRANLPGEVKSVVDEGVSRGMLDANEPIVRQLVTANNRRLTADRAGLARARTQALAAATGTAARAAGDSHFGYGQYAEAVELYRAALQKGGEDPNLVNSRLGAALALAGLRAEAEMALRAVTGPRADLAAFWLAWLARRPA